MNIEQILVIFARTLFVGAEVIALLGFCFLLYMAIQVRRRPEKSKRKNAAAYLGVIGSIISLSTLIVGFVLYFQAQEDRKHQVEQLSGISKAIDGRIEKSLNSHLSYFQAVSIKENAFDACEEISKENSNQEKISKCKKINIAGINGKVMGAEIMPLR